MVKTHSRATLKNTERIVIEGEPTYVFRYINRDHVKRIFEDRKPKAEEVYQLGLLAESKGNVSEATQYYYWGLGLSISHP